MKALFTTFCLVAFLNSYAQEPIADQNPNYQNSLRKYSAVEDSLQITMNTTVQQTYKAFDWYEAKQERRQTRFNTRQQVRINRSMNNFGFDNGWNNNGWNNNGWDNNGWNNNNNWRNNRWNNNGWNNNRFFPGSIGFRSGNWCFFL
jgi:hypothetical protein